MSLPSAWQEQKSVLNSTVVRLGLVALLADISSEMLYPITPIFLTAVLGASFSSVGLIEGVAEGLASILKVFSGALSDRFRKHKALVALGYFFSAAGKPVIGGAHFWPRVLFARSLDRLGKGIRSAPRDSWLSEAVPAYLRGAAFGWHRGMDTLGAFVGPLIALLFINGSPEQLRQAYYWALIPGLLAVATVFAVRDPEHKVRPAKVSTPDFHVALTPQFKRYLGIWFVFSLVNSSDAFLLLKVKHEGLSLTHVTLLYCFYNLIYALGSPFLGGLSDRTGRKPILAGGFFLFALVYLGFAFANQSWQFLALFFVYGIYMAGTDGVGKALAVDLLPDHAKGTGIGWLGLVTGVATVFASVAAGSLWDHFGAGWPFIYGAVGALIAHGLLHLVRLNP